MLFLQRVKDGCVKSVGVNDSSFIQKNAVEMDAGEGDERGIDGKARGLFRLFQHNGVLSGLLGKT